MRRLLNWLWGLVCPHDGGVVPTPTFPPEMIVCRDHGEAMMVRAQLPTDSHIKVVWPTISQISMMAPQRITVSSTVDLRQDVDGEGRLVDLLYKRQQTWDDRAVFIKLGDLV